ncbi:aspartate--tRNA ligase [Mycoplasma todarodis]|uniref:Aspartate--tRNA ligase n=1 Tax=Mycoplasma todarodis TaxID=1937191 RepID=A0A4R0XKM3_9MOLU|nr:aspartate--tRNA ligase [Mycoplasma todarodis]TCG11206.1 aspartate--tRNA ligase [Mycoplasma todarodis]
MKKINNGQLRKNDAGKTVTLKGWIANRRKMGSLTFIDLRDRWGITQIVVEGGTPQDATKESVIEVTGKVAIRKDINPDMPTGEIEIISEELKVLATSEVPPFVIRDDIEIKEDNRLKHRFMDLRRTRMTQNLILRHKLIKAVRDYLDERDFLEVETPYLSKSTPEGARDYLVPTRAHGKFFALPQSPQLYKQLLMASGIEKYFQVARCFRDEDLRADRQPEFTQLDMEMSFTTQKDIMELIEGMYTEVFKKLGFNDKLEFPIMEYDTAMDLYGCDKPDLRYEYKLIEVTEKFKNTTFNAFKTAPTIKMIAFDKVLSKKQIKKLEEVAKKNKAKGLAWASFDGEEKTGPGYKFFEAEINSIAKEVEWNTGTLLFVADKYDNAVQALGAVRVELNRMFKLASDGFKFTWIVNWPMFEYNEEADRYIAAHHPFTSPTDETLDFFDTKPLEARAKAYDLVLNGFEIGGGSIRINNPETQRRMFSAIGMTQETAESQFGFFLEAFKYGLPPHGGIAFGVDRLATILVGEESIREVIAFPKNAKGIDPMSQSPSDVTTEQLEEYNLILKEE